MDTRRIPEFQLPSPEGTLLDHRWLGQRPATLLMVYKSSCATSLFALEILQQVWQRVSLPWALGLLISQDDPESTRTLVKRHGIRFPVVVDFPEYRLSRRLGFTTVPALYLVNRHAEILRQVQGFVRAEYETILERLFEAHRLSVREVFPDAASIPPLKPG